MESLVSSYISYGFRLLRPLKCLSQFFYDSVLNRDSKIY